MGKEVKDSAYFISWYSLNAENQQVGYGSSLIPFADLDAFKEVEESYIAYALKEAKECDLLVTAVHIIAFNKV